VDSNPIPKVDPDLILNSQVAQGMAVIGDRWAFMIIRDIYLGIRQFEEFRRRNNIARGTLASRLKSLVERGILCKAPYQTAPIRYEYRLTEKGLDMYPILLMSWVWETKWGKGRFLPPVLTHNLCGKDMHPRLRCGHCHLGITPRDVRFTAGNRARSVKKVPARHQRRSKSKEEFVGGSGEKAFTMLDIVGDRWTSLVVAAAFFGLQRYDDIAASIGIATNILADRLKLLVHIGVLNRVAYQERPQRFEYHLSEMGRDLYSHTLTIHEWADRWLICDGESPLILRHVPCDEPLVSEVVCSECEQPLVASDVSFDKEPRHRVAVQ
jgi:DNA-binding HxlR family transcriptional regulator